MAKYNYILWVNRVYVTMDAIRKHDWEMVNFTFSNRLTGKETTKRMSLYNAILLGERRREDGRYKNYEFYID